MTRSHFNATTRAFKERVPFRPFTVTLVNGRGHEVDHPGALVLTRGRGGAALYVRPGGGMVVFDHEGVAEIADGLKGPADDGGDEKTSEKSSP